jgi:hypothetical protein
VPSTNIKIHCARKCSKMTAHRPSFFSFADEGFSDYSSLYGKPGFFVPCGQIKQLANFLKTHHAISI